MTKQSNNIINNVKILTSAKKKQISIFYLSFHLRQVYLAYQTCFHDFKENLLFPFSKTVNSSKYEILSQFKSCSLLVFSSDD